MAAVGEATDALATVFDALRPTSARAKALDTLLSLAQRLPPVVMLLRERQVCLFLIALREMESIGSVTLMWCGRQLIAFLIAVDARNKAQVEEEADDEEDEEPNAFAARIWQMLTQGLDLALVDVSNPELLQQIWHKLLRERYSPREILLSMAQFLTKLLAFDFEHKPAIQSIDLLTFRLQEDDDDCDCCALVRHFYVALSGSEQSSRLLGAFGRLIRSKAQVRVILRHGMLRTVLQVAVQQRFDSDSVQDMVAFARCVCRVVCINGDQGIQSSCTRETPSKTSNSCLEQQMEQDTTASQEASILCSLIVRLLLSLVSIARQEALRLIQMLLEVDAKHNSSQCFTEWFVAIPDLHGALEVTQAVLMNAKSYNIESYEVQLCQQQLAYFVPRIRAFEMAHGSLLGLDAMQDEEIMAKGPQFALECCRAWKAKGNELFTNGNFFAARMCYRRGFSLLQQAQFHEETRLNQQSCSDKQADCQVGASVQVWCPNPCNKWNNAMVVDLDSDSSGQVQVEVTFDVDSNEEDEPLHIHDDAVVPLDRLRLRMHTSILIEFDQLRIDCAMNMGKALCQLGRQEEAVNCFGSVLEIQPDHIGALYQRGITNLALNKLMASKQDLWQANQSCLRQKDRKMKVQVSAAWKRLGLVLSRKKKLDRKLVKQLLGYLSTIPGLDQEQSSKG